jgi:hypothetical protein
MLGAPKYTVNTYQALNAPGMLSLEVRCMRARVGYKRAPPQWGAAVTSPQPLAGVTPGRTTTTNRPVVSRIALEGHMLTFPGPTSPPASFPPSAREQL